MKQRIIPSKMSEDSDQSLVVHNMNLYEEDLDDETALDLSSQSLEFVPNLMTDLLCAIYLQNNNIKSLPDDFFPSLPNLMWLDLRDNQLTALPTTIMDHSNLTHLLLQNNKITSLPDALGTLPNLKVLQLGGNPLTYPPKDIIQNGVGKILAFLLKNHFDAVFEQANATTDPDEQSFNSVRDAEILESKDKTALSIHFSEKDKDNHDEDSETDKPERKGRKCRKFSKCILKNIPKHFKRTQQQFSNTRSEIEKLKDNIKKERAMQKHKDLMAMQEKILQDRRNLQLLQDWRRNYRTLQYFTNPDAKLDPNSFPYGTNPEYFTLLSREDIEKDLPDKYRKSLTRRCRPSVPRKKTGDVHLAMKIKQLFDNLEAIDVKRQGMTPRTEQRVLLGEIQKITEIKQKLMELSVSNTRSVIVD